MWLEGNGESSGKLQAWGLRYFELRSLYPQTSRLQSDQRRDRNARLPLMLMMLINGKSQEVANTCKQ